MSTTIELGDLMFRLVGDGANLSKAVVGGVRDLNRLQTTSDKLAGVVKMAAVAMGAAFVGVATTIAYSVKKSIDEMDKLGKASQRIGVPVEQLSALAYSAQLSDVSLDALIGSVTKLNRSLGTVNDPTSEAGTAFKAMGIKVTEANGHLKDTASLILEVSDKFKGYTDGANKSAIAMAIFGRSGSDMIPMLNEGAAAIRNHMSDAKNFNVVVGRDAAAAADKFNNSMKELTTRLSGWAIMLANDALPTLTRFATQIDYAATLGNKFYLAFLATDERTKGAVDYVASLTKNFEALTASMESTNTQLAGFQGLASKLQFPTGVGGAQKDAPSVGDAQTFADNARAMVENAKANIAASLGDTLGDSTKTAIEKLAQLDDALKKRAITWHEYGQAVKQVNDEQRDNITSLASDVATALTSVFQNNKGAAIAQAIINTAVGITQAMQLPPPFDLAKAALVAATGVAQVAAIRSTSPSGGGASPSVPASVGGGGDAGGGAGGDGGGGQQNTLHVSGIGANDLFTGEMVRGLSESIIKYQRDGGKILLDGVL